jgi:3-phosphoshikimate 1-carboxyvinyltransferase
MGARIVAREGCRLPLALTGAADILPIEYVLPVPSAQVKSAVLLAGLAGAGTTTVVEKEATRDHTERMLRHFGAQVAVEEIPGGGRRIALTGQPELAGAALTVPGDPSSAAFPVVAALLVPDSELRVTGVGINRLRAGLFETLAEMGAALEVANRRHAGGEEVADLVVRGGGELRGVDVPPERAPRMIDEYPVLAVAAAFARGRTRMRGLAELRVKESDRLGAIAEGLAACGVRLAVDGDTLTVEGTGAAPAGGATIAARLDHRIAMAFLVMGLAAKAPVRIDDGATIATSFPGFVELMVGAGARIEPA